jgi:hypothetical protein
MFCVPSGVTANFATVSEIRGIREKIAKGVGKTAFCRPVLPGTRVSKRLLTRGTSRVGYIISKLRPSSIGPIADMRVESRDVRFLGWSEPMTDGLARSAITLVV